MYLWIIRVLFVLISTVLGYFTKNSYGAIVGFAISAMLVILEYFLKRSALKDLLACLVGLIIGLTVACLIIHIGSTVGIKNPFFVTGASLILSYIGMMTVYRRRDELNIPLLASHKSQSNLQQYDSKSKSCKILDTSVLIDGRISDICQTGLSKEHYWYRALFCGNFNISLIPQMVLDVIRDAEGFRCWI